MRETRFCFASSRLRSAVTFALVAAASACSRVAVACASAARYGAVSMMHERMAFLDHAAFLIYALLQHTRDAGAHVRCARGRKTAGGFAHQRHWPGMHDDDADLGRWRLLRSLLLAAGGDKQSGNSRGYQLNA